MNNIVKKSVIILLTVAIPAFCLISCLCFGNACGEVRSDVLRLHILANSDSTEDQQVKLLVRDALLQHGSQIFDGSVTVENAAERLETDYAQLVSVAKAVLRENGFSYDADIRITNEYFETRTYDNVTLPAGRYTSLKVVLGEGEGHNWWCVMFPPLCLPACCNSDALEAYFNGDETQLLESNPKYEIRFKIVEIYERFKNKNN